MLLFIQVVAGTNFGRLMDKINVLRGLVMLVGNSGSFSFGLSRMT